MTRRQSSSWPCGPGFFLTLGLALGAGYLAPPPAATAETANEIHGADAVFAGRGIAVVWGVARGADETTTVVVIRVASRNPALQAVGIDLVDPFIPGRRVEALAPSSLESAGTARIARARLAEYPRLELRLAGGVEILASGAAALTIYYTGVPDAAPEFTSEAALAEYLDAALARARR